MDACDIERLIEEELSKLSVTETDSDTSEEEVTDVCDDGGDADALSALHRVPASVLTYLQTSQHRVTALEKLLLEDLDDNDLSTADMPRAAVGNCEELPRDLASAFDEDPVKCRDRIISEIEVEVAIPAPNHTNPQHAEEDPPNTQRAEGPPDADRPELDTEWQLRLELTELEERLRVEEERRTTEQREEREQRLASAREEEERRRKRQREFEAELGRLQQGALMQSPESEKMAEDAKKSLRMELANQQEVIRRLQQQVEEEWCAFEEAQELESRRRQEAQRGAATRIQAAWRGVQTRRWSSAEIRRRREEKRRREEEERKERERRREREERTRREREERTRREREERRRESEERRRAEEQERRLKEEMERRREEYERAKERERLRLAWERQLEEQRREEEEEKRREREEKERRRQEEEKRIEDEKQKEVERRKAEEERKREEEEKRKLDEENKRKRKEEEEQQRDEERKRSEEQRAKAEEDDRKRKEERESSTERTVGKNTQRGALEQAEAETDQKTTERKKDEIERDGEPEHTGTGVERGGREGILKRETETGEQKTEEGRRGHGSHPHLSPDPPPFTPHGLADHTSPTLSTCTTSVSLAQAGGSATDAARPEGLSPGWREEAEVGGLRPDPAGAEGARGARGAEGARGALCLPDSTEQKRLAWMMSCTPWSTLSMRNRRKEPPKGRGPRRALQPSPPPLPMDAVLQQGPWGSMQQVTMVTLENLPACSLATLGECSRLRSLSLRRCGITALEGLSACTQLTHIDLQENAVSSLDCRGLVSLQVLLLGRNRLSSIHGLDGALSLSELQLSHNHIARIGGLESLRGLQKLAVDHNQVVSMRGLAGTVSLLHLDCSHNHLSSLEGLEDCALLHTLDLTGNNLTEPPRLMNHVLMRELHLDGNSISTLSGLESCWMPLLHTLTAARNSITSLPPLSDLVSLTTLDLSQNCLTELQDVCVSLQGYVGLRALVLADNPAQRERCWRSAVLRAAPGLLRLDGHGTGVPTAPPVAAAVPCSFLALCDSHQHQLGSLLQRHEEEIGSAPSLLAAQLLSCNHSSQRLLLAEEQRYAHEYGEKQECESRTQSELSGMGHQVSRSAAERLSVHDPTFDMLRCGPSSAQVTADSGLPAPQQPIRGTELRRPRLDLRTVAAVIIQRHWRGNRKDRSLSGPAAKHCRKCSPQKELICSGVRAGAPSRDYAATIIQAVWRGWALRRRLTHALDTVAAEMAAGEEGFEEVDLDEFVFDEEALDEDWTMQNSNSSPSGTPQNSQLLPLPKQLLPLPVLPKSPQVSLWKPKQAWTNEDRVSAVFEKSCPPDLNSRVNSSASIPGPGFLTSRPERILEEWGISSSSTAVLMLKRAQRMKSRSLQHRRLLGPSARLALFRSHSNQSAATETGSRPHPERQHNVKADPAVPAGQAGAVRVDRCRGQREHTYQWLHTQAGQAQWSPADPQSQDDPSDPGDPHDPASDHFLPEIDPEIINGGRVQLVASAWYRAGSVRSWSGGSSGSSAHHAHTPPRRHPVTHTEKAPAPKRLPSTPPRTERMSFRDAPVRLSGGWGGGKRGPKATQ